MKRLAIVVLLAGGSAFAQENERPILVISAAATPGAAGGSVGLFRDEGRLRYGLSALVTAGDSSWAGASIDARWSLLQGPFTPYLGLGIGAFSMYRNGVDLGIQPTATADAGIEFHRFFAGARALVPLTSRNSGVAVHDAPGLSDPAVLALLGFRI